MDLNNRLFIAANSSSTADKPKPIRIRRPGQKYERQRGTTLAEFQQMMKGRQ